MESRDNFNAELLFAALADTTRLRILNLMRGGEVCVCFFAGALGTNNPKISRHLSYLKRASLVKGRRDGKWMHYGIQRPENPQAARILEETLRMIENEPVYVADRARLASGCCDPVQISRNRQMLAAPAE